MLMVVSLGCAPERLQAGNATEGFTAMAPGWTFDRVDIVDDLDGDGLSDAVVIVCNGTSLCLHLVVHSPLRRDLTLPGDEAATLPGYVGAVDVAGDVTGDGVADLRVVGGDDYLLFEGPVVGDPGDGIPSAGAFLDTNQDGQLDEHAFRFETGTSNMTLEIKFGPMSAWGPVADVVLDPSCDSYTSDDWSFSPPSLWPDFVGDGFPRLLFHAATYSYDCQGWWIPLPLADGVYAPDLDPDAISASHGFNVLPDQTGDGIADIVFPVIGEPVDVYAGPLVIEGGVATTGDLVAPLPTTLSQMIPIPFDLNRDGIGEFLVRDLPPGRTALVYGGAEGLLAADVARPWPGTAERAFLENGIVSIWMVQGKQALVIDLGSGVPL